MVFSSAGEDYMLTTGRERRKTRHNFTVPDLKWGVQRSLRCMKVGSISVNQRRHSPSQSDGCVDNRNRRLETERWRSEEGKIMSDLRTEAERVKESIFRERVVDYEDEDKKEKEREVSPPEAPGVTAEAKPWNLRKRRAACKAPVTESGNCDDEGAKFMSTLTKKEMEDDYLAMMGHRPPRRPKKRLRAVQKQIDFLHPALYFTEVTEGIYEVPDAVETRKR